MSVAWLSPGRPTAWRPPSRPLRDAIAYGARDKMPVNLPTNLLRSFVAIVDAGSMLNAAEQVFVTQSALSLQIKRLEELVQQPLFTREGRRLQLTGSGEVLLDYARRMLSLPSVMVRCQRAMCSRSRASRALRRRSGRRNCCRSRM